jgi:hypothetical protein
MIYTGLYKLAMRLYFLNRKGTEKRRIAERMAAAVRQMQMEQY